MTKFKGYLDRLRENIQALDDGIAIARTMSKKKDRSALQWAKTLRDLIELRNSTLDRIKAHLLGRDESGAITEPNEFFEGDTNPEIMFEREFKNWLSPWTRQDLELECQDCHKSSEEVSEQAVVSGYSKWGGEEYEHVLLCPDCYAKRQAKEPKEPNQP